MKKELNKYFDNEYLKWINDLKINYQNKLIKINLNINYEMLDLYWNIGKKIEEMKNGYKKVPNGFYARISFDLKEIFQNVKGISETNINYMNRFFNNYKDILEENLIPPKLGGESIDIESFKKNLFSIPWGHQKILIDKIKNNYEKIFYYTNRILYDDWSRETLMRNIKNDIQTKRKIAINNFSLVLENKEIKQIENITKDPYVLDFLNLTSNFSEKELKNKLIFKY